MSVTDNLGRKVNYSYAASSILPSLVQVTSKTGQLAKSLNFTYDAHGNLTRLVDGDARVLMENTYDAQGRVIAQQDGKRATTQFSYSAGSNGTSSTTVTNPSAKKTTYKFDSNWQLVEIDDPDGYSESWTMDAAGNQITHTNKNGHTTSYGYDSQANLLAVIDPNRGITRMAYDSTNRLISVTDQKGQTTSFTYDTSNNVSSIVDPLNNKTTLTWNSSSLLQTRKGGASVANNLVTDFSIFAPTQAFAGGAAESTQLVTTIAQTTLQDGTYMLAVVKNGQILAQSTDLLLSHSAFVSRALGTLPEGAEAVTILKEGGQITVLNSMTFHGNQLPASPAVTDTIFRCIDNITKY